MLQKMSVLHSQIHLASRKKIILPKNKISSKQTNLHIKRQKQFFLQMLSSKTRSPRINKTRKPSKTISDTNQNIEKPQKKNLLQFFSIFSNPHSVSFARSFEFKFVFFWTPISISQFDYHSLSTYCCIHIFVSLPNLDF